MRVSSDRPFQPASSCRANGGQNRPSSWMTSPSALRRPPRRRSHDQVPVHGALVRAARLGIRRPSARWTVPPIFSSNRIAPTGPVDAGVGADAELPQPPRAGVRVERGQQVVLADARPARRPRGPRGRPSSTPSDRHAARARGDRDAQRALRRVLVRAREDLARGHVAPAVGVHPRAPVHAQAQVGALGLDVDLAGAGEAGDQRGLARREVASRRRRGRPGRGRSRGGRRRRTPRCPCRPAGRRPGSARTCRTSGGAGRPRAPGGGRGRRGPCGPAARRPARGCSPAPG